MIDLRTIAPLDRETILASVAKTGRLLVVHEDNISFGVGAEVAAMVAEGGRVSSTMGGTVKAPSLTRAVQVKATTTVVAAVRTWQIADSQSSAAKEAFGNEVMPLVLIWLCFGLCERPVESIFLTPFLWITYFQN